MDIKDSVNNALSELTSGGLFDLIQIDYDEKNFGNICILLKSSKNLEIKFIKDKGVFWCEIGQAGDWFFIEDVFNAIEHPMGYSIEYPIEYNGEGFIDYLNEISSLLTQNLQLIFHIFNSTESEKIQNRIKEFAKKRAIEMFK